MYSFLLGVLLNFNSIGAEGALRYVIIHFSPNCLVAEGAFYDPGRNGPLSLIPERFEHSIDQSSSYSTLLLNNLRMTRFPSNIRDRLYIFIVNNSTF